MRLFRNRQKKYSDVKFIFQLYRFDRIEERISLLESYKIPKDRYFTFIHPSCMIARSAQIGIGTIIMANTVVNSNAIIGKYCTIQSTVTIGHDSKMGDYNFISIGDNCFIGMASNVVKSLPSNTKVYGNPAKPFFTNIKPL